MTHLDNGDERSFIEAQPGITQTGTPCVHLHVRKGDAKIVCQVDPEQAREIAGHLFEAAEASLSDALIIRFFTSRISLDLERAGAILMDFRALREAQAQKGDK